MKRVLIIGCAGAGKSTLARKLAARTGLPLIHLDREYWHAGWVATADDAWSVKVAELAGGSRWIMDGNYGQTLGTRLAVADAVIFLDFPTRVCLWRVLRRSVEFRGRTREDMAAGCVERFDWAFLVWVWRYRRRSRPRVLRELANFGGRVVVLRDRAAVTGFLGAAEIAQQGVDDN